MAEAKKYPTPVVPLPQKEEEKTGSKEDIKTEKAQQSEYDLSLMSMVRSFEDMMVRFSAALRGAGQTTEEQTTNDSQIAPPIVPKPENNNTTLAANIERSQQETQ